MSATATRTGTIATLFSNMAFQDWLALAFHVYMWLRVTLAPDSADASAGRRLSGFFLVLTLSTILLVRGELLPAGGARALLYRVCLTAGLICTYFALRWVLPALQPTLVDMQLLAIDEALFGITPAVFLNSLITSVRLVDWFAFFYYCYFYVLGGMVFPTLFFGRGLAQRQLLIGAVVVCVVGHFMYTLVPGRGPVAYDWLFDGPVHGGFWWSNVRVAVDTAGAQLDIFPSLHTAFPTFFTIVAFSLRHENRILRYAWPLLGFIAANIIVATMLLRWHWGIDVVAGLILALGANQIGAWVGRWEAYRGVDGGDRQRVWEPLWPRDREPERHRDAPT